MEGCQEQSSGASCSALQGSISGDLLGGLTNGNQTLSASIPVCSGVQLTLVAPGYEGQAVLLHLTSRSQTALMKPRHTKAYYKAGLFCPQSSSAN